ncbi:GroES-like protein [Canariomyces notabilis]|uniref:GroES-like protein n=1 Tax=Canariomyces notabilis TaxID=2074819 RepID=A0AAN6YT34_9PEZI|nr:GroES-like protein [Canariomyces arenarius]
MRSLVAPRYCQPAGYEVIDLPTPTPDDLKPNDVLIRVHAAAIQTGDTQAAAGVSKLLVSTKFPLRLGMSGSGIVIAVGSGVKSLRVGDAVCGLAFKHGQIFEEAAALTGSVLTAYQCVKRYFELTGQPPGTSTLEGKTVFIPGALSAAGSVSTQVVKNVYGAKTVVSTVSTPKMGLVEKYLPDVVDELVNYETQNIVQEVGRGTVDFVLNTQWDLVGTFPLANPQTGAVVSIASIPSPRTVRSMIGDSPAPILVRWFILAITTLAHMWYNWMLRGTKVKQDFVSGNPGNREDLERSGEWVAAGKIKAVMTVVDIEDIEAVRKACTMVATGKGGIGKLVIRLA